MSAFTVHCPECRTALRSARPLPPGQVVRCPQCGGFFNHAEQPEETAPPVPPVRSPTVSTGLIAFGLVGLLVLLFAGGVGLAVLATRNPDKDAAVDRRAAEAERRATEAERRAAEERLALQKRLDEQRDRDDRERRRLERAIEDLEVKAKARDERPAPPVPVVAAPPPEQKPAPDDGEKRKRDQYEAHMEAGRQAMVAQRYPDALRDYQAALRLVPGDPAAERGRRDAEDRLGGQAERRNRRDSLAGLLDKARTALRAKHYDEAVEAANEAVRTSPDDADAKQLQREAKQQQRAAKAKYREVMSQADTALAAGRFEEASGLYSQALQLMPDDSAAQRGKQNADQVARDTQSSQSAYYRYMTGASLSMQNGLYADAMRSYAEALRLYPGDVAAARGLSDAQAGLAGTLAAQANYYRQLQAAYAAMQSQRPNDALAAFQAAQNINPGNPQAAAGLRQAQTQVQKAQTQVQIPRR